MSQLNPLLNTAFKAARKTGGRLMRHVRNLNDAKTDSTAFNALLADIRADAEHTLVQALLEAYPDHAVTGAGGTHGNGRSGHEWLVNALDGGRNYLHEHPQYAVSVALRVKGALQEALVYAPESNELYTASRGKGALLNDRRIRVSKRIELNRNAVIGQASPLDSGSLPFAAALADKEADVRREGAVSLDLCRVACGHTDGCFAFGLAAWESAAGSLIVQEAGGIVTDHQGDENWLAQGGLVAANPKVLAQLLQTFKHIQAA